MHLIIIVIESVCVTLKDDVEACERPERERIEPWRMIGTLPNPLSMRYF